MGYKESILQPLYDTIQLLCTAKVCRDRVLLSDDMSGHKHWIIRKNLAFRSIEQSVPFKNISGLRAWNSWF